MNWLTSFHDLLNSVLPVAVSPLEYPKAMMHAAFASINPSVLIPEVVKSFLIGCHLLYRLLFARNREHGSDEQGRTDQRLVVLETCLRGMDAVGLDNEQRVSCLVEWGILERDARRPMLAVVEGAKVYRLLSAGEDVQ